MYVAEHYIFMFWIFKEWIIVSLINLGHNILNYGTTYVVRKQFLKYQKINSQKTNSTVFIAETDYVCCT